MSIAFTYYAKIRNNYCISYYGLIPEYVVMLRLLRPYMNKLYPELRIFISCRDEIMYLLEEEPDIIGYSEIHDRKNDFAYIREINTSINPPHTIESLVHDSLPGFKPTLTIVDATSRRCLICPDGALPTRSYSDSNKLREFAESRGYKTTIVGSDIHPGTAKVDVRPGNEKLKFLNDTDWVLGVENEFLFEAVRRGIKTTLIQTGFGGNLYKLLNPKAEIINL